MPLISTLAQANDGMNITNRMINFLILLII